MMESEIFELERLRYVRLLRFPTCWGILESRKLLKLRSRYLIWRRLKRDGETVPLRAVELELESETSLEVVERAKTCGFGLRRSMDMTLEELEQWIPCQLQQLIPCHEERRPVGSVREALKLKRAALSFSWHP